MYNYKKAIDAIKDNVPLQITLLEVNKRMLDREYIMEVTESQTVSGNDLNPAGLNSTVLFGPLGGENRLKNFGFINMNIDVIHPRLYGYITTLSSFYGKILDGKATAVYDKKSGFFTPSDDGETGYSFFMKHIRTVQLPAKSSTDRQNMIKVVKDAQRDGTIVIKELLVIPPLFREVVIEPDGSIVEHELNDLYRAVLLTANVFKSMRVDKSADAFRRILQKRTNDIFEYLVNLIDGKKKAVNASWVSRSLDLGTRNVITAKENVIETLDFDSNEIDYTLIGTLQFVKSIEPYAIHHILTAFMQPLFDNISATLFNLKTNKWETLELTSKTFDSFTTAAGINRLINTCKDSEGKERPIMIDGYALCPVVDKGGEVTLYQNFDIAEEDLQYVRPLTYGEMLYISIYDRIDKTASTFTRYPVTDPNSCYIALVKVDTTSDNRKVKLGFISATGTHELDVSNYPIIGSPWNDSMSPNYTRLNGLGADYDGDKCSFNATLSQEAYEEAVKHLESIINMLDSRGGLYLEIEDDIIKRFCQTMTRA